MIKIYFWQTPPARERRSPARPLEPVLGVFTIRYLQFGITP